MIPATRELRHAVAAGLPGASPPATDLVVTPEIVGQAVAHRVQGLLWAAIETGVASGPPEVLAQAENSLAIGIRTCLVAEETAVLALDALASARVETRALKGVAVAHLDHPDPTRRMFGDADILVRPGTYRHALSALEAAGFRRSQPAHRLGWETRFGKSVVMRSPRGAELDLHLRITGGYFGERLDHEALWSRPAATFTVAGREVQALDAPGRLLNACCHAVLGGYSGLRALHDVALLTSRGDGWSQTVAIATEDGLRVVIAQAIRTTWEQLYLDSHHPAIRWATEYQPSRGERTALASYATSADVDAVDEDRGVLLALAPVDKVRYLAGLAFPPRASLAARGRTYRSHLYRGLGVLRRAGSR